VILKYVRLVIKRRDTQILSCPPAPVGVLDGSRADVSFIAGMIVDKFTFHLPLYRQHLRLGDSGIDISRPWLTQVMQSAVALLEPIHDAQLAAIRTSRVISMDETSIKAGPTGTGKMKAAYFWPVYGEMDEICFLYYPSRSARYVQDALGLFPPKGAVLQTDGYSCWRRTGRSSACSALRRTGPENRDHRAQAVRRHLRQHRMRHDQDADRFGARDRDQFPHRAGRRCPDSSRPRLPVPSARRGAARR